MTNPVNAYTNVAPLFFILTPEVLLLYFCSFILSSALSAVNTSEVFTLNSPKMGKMAVIGSKFPVFGSSSCVMVGLENMHCPTSSKPALRLIKNRRERNKNYAAF